MNKTLVQLYGNFGRLLPRGLRMVLDPIMENASTASSKGSEGEKKDKKDKKKKGKGKGKDKKEKKDW